MNIGLDITHYLYPLQNRIPFSILQHILSYRPNYTTIPRYDLLQKHLRTKYCPTCGEYIDLHNPKYRTRHVHLRYRRYYKYDSTSSYHTSPLSPFHVQLHLPNDISHEEYKRLQKQTYSAWVVYKKKHNKYFYNFKKMLHSQSRTCELRVNTLDMNCFKNIHFYLMEDFFYLFPHMKPRWTLMSSHKIFKISSSFDQSFSMEHQIIRLLQSSHFHFLLYNYRIFFLFDTCKQALLQCLLSSHGYSLQFMELPVYFYVQLIKYSYEFIPHIHDSILQLCVSHYPLDMIQCVKRDIHYSFFMNVSFIE